MNTLKKILVLKTSITTLSDLIRLDMLFLENKLILNWNVDLEDCDKVLRIECYDLKEEDVAEILQHIGFKAEELPNIVVPLP